MGAVLLTGATGFVGMELLNRFLSGGERHVYALVRASDDRAAAGRLPAHPRLTAVAGDIEKPGLGLDAATTQRLAGEVTTVMHCAASVSFDLSLPDSRRINVDGTRHMLEFAERCEDLERFSYVSTAYVGGEPDGLFREDQLDVGQSFRNAYERSKFEAELMLRERGRSPAAPGAEAEHRRGRQPHRADLLLQRPLRPAQGDRARCDPSDPGASLVAGGHRARGLRGRSRIRPGQPRSHGTFHLVAGRNATSVGRLLDLAGEHLGKRPPAVLPPGPYRRLLHPLLRRRRPGLRRMEVYFPYFSMRVRFDDRELGPAPPVESYFGRLIEFAEQARWGRRPAPVGVAAAGA